jgi:hypothetical protein
VESGLQAFANLGPPLKWIDLPDTLLLPGTYWLAVMADDPSYASVDLQGAPLNAVNALQAFGPMPLSFPASSPVSGIFVLQVNYDCVIAPSETVSPSSTFSPSPTSSATASPSPTGSGTASPSATLTATPSASPSASSSASPSPTPSVTATATASATATLSFSATETATASATATLSHTAGPSATPTPDFTPTLGLAPAQGSEAPAIIKVLALQNPFPKGPGLLYLKLEGNAEGFEIEVFSPGSTLVAKSSVPGPAGPGNNFVPFDATKLPQGLYFVRLTAIGQGKRNSLILKLAVMQ